jgi:hypothetical protein
MGLGKKPKSGENEARLPAQVGSALVARRSKQEEKHDA